MINSLGKLRFPNFQNFEQFKVINIFNTRKGTKISRITYEGSLRKKMTFKKVSNSIKLFRIEKHSKCDCVLKMRELSLIEKQLIE